MIKHIVAIDSANGFAKMVDGTLGIPWDTQVLGKAPSTVYIAQKMQNEAKKLPIVDQALCTVYFDRETRSTRGTMRLTDTEGNTAQVTI